MIGPNPGIGQLYRQIGSHDLMNKIQIERQMIGTAHFENWECPQFLRDWILFERKL